MQTYPLSQLTEETLNTLVELHEQDGPIEVWKKMQIPLTAKEGVMLDYLKADTQQRHLTRLNEATLWARTIYPLLRLAEQGQVCAWAGVLLKATYPTFELEGEADGALAPAVAGKIRGPYLVVHEAKRGINAPDPLCQLYGEMLAAAWINWKTDPNPEQQIFGCYTITDDWTFVHGSVSEIESERPVFHVEFSPRYNGILEAERIVQLLKFIVAKRVNVST